MIRPLSFLLAMLLSSSAFAASWRDAEPFASEPAELLAGLEGAVEDPDAPGVALLHEERGFSYDSEGLETETIYRVYGITQQAMVDSWGITEVGWAPWHQQRPEVQVRVVNASGQVHTLTGEEMNEVIRRGWAGGAEADDEGGES